VSNRFADPLLPYTTNQYNLGSSTYCWQELWVKDANFSNEVNITTALTVEGDLTVNNNTTLGDATSDTNIFNGSLTANLPDNQTDALDIQQGSNNYFNINTTDAAEVITLGNLAQNIALNLHTGTSNFEVNSGQFVVDGNGNITLNSASGNVGIGTTNPTTLFPLGQLAFYGYR
jgi:hypothetical protein